MQATLCDNSVFSDIYHLSNQKMMYWFRIRNLIFKCAHYGPLRVVLMTVMIFSQIISIEPPWKWGLRKVVWDNIFLPCVTQPYNSQQTWSWCFPKCSEAIGQFFFLISLSSENVSGGFLQGLLTAISFRAFTYGLRKFSRMSWHRWEDFGIIFRQFCMTGRYNPATWTLQGKGSFNNTGSSLWPSRT